MAPNLRRRIGATHGVHIAELHDFRGFGQLVGPRRGEIHGLFELGGSDLLHGFVLAGFLGEIQSDFHLGLTIDQFHSLFLAFDPAFGSFAESVVDFNPCGFQPGFG